MGTPLSAKVVVKCCKELTRTEERPQDCGEYQSTIKLVYLKVTWLVEVSHFTSKPNPASHTNHFPSPTLLRQGCFCGYWSPAYDNGSNLKEAHLEGIKIYVIWPIPACIDLRFKVFRKVATRVRHKETCRIEDPISRRLVQLIPSAWKIH